MTEGTQAFFGSMLLTGTGLTVLWRCFPDVADRLICAVVDWLDRK